MDLGQAAQAVLELVSWSGLPESISRELKICAKEDLKAAAALVTYARSNYLFGVSAVEGTLYSLVTLLYLPTCLQHVSDLEACAASSSVRIQHMLCLLKFASSLNSLDFEPSLDAEASDLLEELWRTHCLNRGFQVSSEVCFERVFGPEDGDEGDLNRQPLQPARLPVCGRVHGDNVKKLWCGRPASRNKDHNEQGKQSSSQLQSIPKLFDVMTMVTESDFFVQLPLQNIDKEASTPQERSSCSKVVDYIDHELLTNPQLKELLLPLRNLVVSTYRKIEHDGRQWDFGELDRSLVPLTVGEAHEILRAAECNCLLRHLVAQRPGKARLLSHEMAMTDAAERARLFLARVDLPVYYHLPLTYAQLCTRDAQDTVEEMQAFSSAVALEPLSPFDKELRQLTLKYMWYVGGSTVVHMKPEDYARAGAAQHSKAWNAVQKFAFPVVVNPSDTIEQSCHSNLVTVTSWICNMITAYLEQEPQDKQDWVFSCGKPDSQELSLASLMSIRTQ